MNHSIAVAAHGRAIFPPSRVADPAGILVRRERVPSPLACHSVRLRTESLTGETEGKCFLTKRTGLRDYFQGIESVYCVRKSGRKRGAYWFD